MYVILYLFLHVNCRTRLLDLAVSLLPGLNSGEVDNLFTATKLALQVSNSSFVLLCKGSVTLTMRRLH